MTSSRSFPRTRKAAEEDKEANVWEDNWDDDNVEDDFATQLRAMKRPASSRSPPPLSPPPSKRKCVQSTPPPGQEMDISQALNGRQQQRTNGRSSATSVTSTPPGSPRRGRGRSATPTDSEPSRRSGRLRKK